MAEIQTTTILNLAEKTQLDSADAFVIDTASGTKKITQENIIDDTLEMSGKLADAKAVGDAIKAQKTTIDAALALKADQTALTAEATAREQAIAAEATAREAADDALKADLTSEQTARETADTALQTAINAKADSTALTAEQTARQNADNALDEDIAALSEDVETNYAKIDGYYDSLGVGMADQLASNKYTEDNEPYVYRTSGGSADIGDREYDTIVGGTVVWNQLVENGNFADGITKWEASNGSKAAANNEFTYTIETVGTDFFDNAVIYYNLSIPTNHVIVLHAETYAPYNNGFYMSVRTNRVGQSGIGISNVMPTPNTWSSFSKVTKTINTVTDIAFYWSMNTNYAVGDSVKLRNVYVVDLTQMFGASVADSIYALEQAEAGAGVAWFKKLFPKDYYEYNAGELISVSALQSHDMIGFNQWDEEWEITGIGTSQKIASKNYIPVIPGATYYLYCKNGYAFSNGVWLYDSNKNLIETRWLGGLQTIPSNCHYLKFAMTTAYGTTYNHDICINLSLSGWRNGEYEAYDKHSYPLDSSLTLRGIPKVDNAGNLYYDGDTYESDGTVVRNTILRAYQSGDESLANAITDGTNTVVYSANASAETAEPYASPQIVDDFGTEEYVSTASVRIPVGHNTKYMANLRDKLVHLPNLADSDGAYLIQQTGHTMELVKFRIPKAPTTDGTYTLKATVSGGTPTYTWEAVE